MSNARKLAELVKGDAEKVIGYDENGDIIEHEKYSEDDYISDELVDLWSEDE